VTKSVLRSHPIWGSSLSSKDRGLATRLAAIAGAATVFVVLFTGTAQAHATYKSSNPADESTVSSAPSQITAEFTEPMSNGSYMTVWDPCGEDSSSGSSQTGSSMSVGNTSTAAGTYSVFWRAVSIDSHVTEGTFTFNVSSGEPCPGEEPPEDPGTAPRGGASGTGGSGSGSASSSTGGSGSDGADGSSSDAGSGTASGKEDGGRHSGKHGGNEKDRGGKGNGTGGKDDAGGTSLAADSGPDAPEPPSALEGIPLGGLLFTLAVAAFIGAAAGKIYVSLSGD
jgi:methionine-rich copper-binding protein CopC